MRSLVVTGSNAEVPFMICTTLRIYLVDPAYMCQNTCIYEVQNSKRFES